MCVQVFIEDASLPLDSAAAYYTRTYTVAVPQTLLPDRTSEGSVAHFLLLWNRLPYSFSVQCVLKGSLEALVKRISQCFAQALQLTGSEGFRLGFQAATWQGDRLALFLTGASTSKHFRVEFRSTAEDLLKGVTAQVSEVLGSLFGEVASLL